MDSGDFIPLVEELEENIDDLEEVLSPLFKTSILETATRLPLLDKAQLYALITYAIESLIFSLLRLHGVNAKEHPVFRELTRVKQYFDKIDIAESGQKMRGSVLDKAAASRFIKHALAGDETNNARPAQHVACDKAREDVKAEQLSSKRKRSNEGPLNPNPNTQLVGAISSPIPTSAAFPGSSASRHIGGAVTEPTDAADAEPLSKKHRRSKSAKKREKREKVVRGLGQSDMDGTGTDDNADLEVPPEGSISSIQLHQTPQSSDQPLGDTQSSEKRKRRRRWTKEERLAAKEAAIKATKDSRMEGYS